MFVVWRTALAFMTKPVVVIMSADDKDNGRN